MPQMPTGLALPTKSRRRPSAVTQAFQISKTDRSEIGWPPRMAVPGLAVIRGVQRVGRETASAGRPPPPILTKAGGRAVTAVPMSTAQLHFLAVVDSGIADRGEPPPVPSRSAAGGDVSRETASAVACRRSISRWSSAP